MYTGAAKITFKTVDVSELVPAVSTSIGAIVVDSKKGSMDNPLLVTNKAQFIDEYGKPEVAGYAMHAALGFLQSGKRMYVMRAAKTALYGGVEIKKTGSAQANAGWAVGVANPKAVGGYTFGTDGLIAIFGKNPGAWNNDLSVQVSILSAPDYTFRISVYLDDDAGVANLVETWDVSRYLQVDGYNQQMYLLDKINGASSYIYVADNTIEANTVLPKVQGANLYMLAGSDGVAVTDTEVILAWDKFADPSSYPVNILINGGFTSVPVQTKMRDLANARQDCTCILDMPYSELDSAAGQVTWRNTTQNFNSSYCALYSPWIKIFDEYNGQIVSIPPSGDIASVYALTDYIYGSAHGAPAGYNRGTLARALQLCFGTDLNKIAYTSGERDTLDEAQINVLLNDPGWGIVVFGEETEQSIRSALSNVHIRRLINQISYATTRGCRAYLFEPLIERTYFRVRTAMEQYFAELEGLGCFDNVSDRGWKVVCDSTNNTAADRDNNQLNIWLYIKPVKVAKYIEIKAILTRSTASFEATIAAGIA